jgi:hypothetical protein
VCTRRQAVEQFAGQERCNDQKNDQSDPADDPACIFLGAVFMGGVGSSILISGFSILFTP